MSRRGLKPRRWTWRRWRQGSSVATKHYTPLQRPPDKEGHSTRSGCEMSRRPEEVLPN